MSNSTQNEDTTVKVDYAFIPLDNTECPICGIRTFEHLHQEGTKPKDFVRVSERLPEASKTKDRALQDVSYWINELIEKRCDRVYCRMKIEEIQAKELADARKEVEKMVESKRYRYWHNKKWCYPEIASHQGHYNQSIDDILATLREEEKHG